MTRPTSLRCSASGFKTTSVRSRQGTSTGAAIGADFASASTHPQHSDAADSEQALALVLLLMYQNAIAPTPIAAAAAALAVESRIMMIGQATGDFWWTVISAQFR